MELDKPSMNAVCGIVCHKDFAERPKQAPYEQYSATWMTCTPKTLTCKRPGNLRAMTELNDTALTEPADS